MPLTRRTLEAVALVIAAAVVATMLMLLARADGLKLENGQPLFGDFVAFWSAGRAAVEGDAARVYDPDFIAALNREAVPEARYVAPWRSPPQFLLLIAPFGLLPYAAAAITFLLLSAALYLYAARKLLPDARALIFAATAPAALYHLGTVQTGLLVAGVSGLALHWLDKRPRLAGALIALLSIKPHLAVLWPLLLAFTGRWRAFAAAALASIAFATLAGLAFGFESYARFFENLAPSQAIVRDQSISTPAYASLYANLVGLGVPDALAIALHAASAIAALLVAALIFRRGARETQGAALCAAMLLISPYLYFYDFTLFAVGAALLGAPRTRLETAAVILAWGAGLSLVLGYLAPLPLCALAAWLVLIAAFKRAGSAALRPAPTLRT